MGTQTKEEEIAPIIDGAGWAEAAFDKPPKAPLMFSAASRKWDKPGLGPAPTFSDDVAPSHRPLWDGRGFGLAPLAKPGDWSGL